MTTAFAIPFLVGLTGHRDLRSEDLPALRSILTDQLATLVKSAGDTPVPA